MQFYLANLPICYWAYADDSGTISPVIQVYLLTSWNLITVPNLKYEYLKICLFKFEIKTYKIWLNSTSLFFIY